MSVGNVAALRGVACIGAVALIAGAVACGGGDSAAGGGGEAVTLLNVSYDPTRELYQEVNELFKQEWLAKNGQQVTIQQSHGGSGKQARAVLDGLAADVVTLALAYDVDILSTRGELIAADWQSRLPNQSCPYTSTIVFIVRAGNPKNIHDWQDLVKPGVDVITPNPKTSGVARWNYLAAWAYGYRAGGNSDDAAREFIGALYRNVKVLDTGARGATTTFIQNGIGDVLINWENEAFLTIEDISKGEYEIVIPSLSIKAEPPVAVVDAVVARKGTKEVAEAYLRFLYEEKIQEIVARHHYRPSLESVAAKYRDKFPVIEMVQIDRDFGGWAAAHERHFADGGEFDRLYQPVQ